jgi:hypothetical protein
MEPEASVPKIGPEQAPVQHVPEHLLPPTPEQGLLEKGVERTEQVGETSARVSDAGTAPTVVVPPVQTDDAVISDDHTDALAPAVAADDDLIEKEWVDRAKKIVADTRDDPHQQENAVTALQRDYQKKRYGRELGDAN